MSTHVILLRVLDIVILLLIGAMIALKEFMLAGMMVFISFFIFKAIVFNLTDVKDAIILELSDKVGGLMAELSITLDVLIARIKKEKSLESAADWVAYNFPEKALEAGLKEAYENAVIMKMTIKEEFESENDK